jgi:hypothetical protein
MIFRCLLLVSLVTLASCGGADSPTGPTSEWIDLNSLAPAAGTALTAGDQVAFTATVTCTIVNSDGGHTALLLTDHANRSLNNPSPTATLSKGTKTVTLTSTITVPPTGSTVNVVLPLFINGSDTTRMARTASYPVR